MSKDPAVLFYTSDFLTGTAFFTDSERGQYITLLCVQHQNGGLPEGYIKTVCGSLTTPVITKFKKDADGLYYNERMRYETERRNTFCKSRKHNREQHNKEPNNQSTYDEHTDPRMETENETENITEISKGGPGENSICFYDYKILTAELLQSDTWKNDVCRVAAVEPSEIDALISEFCLLRHTSEEMGQALSEYKRWFSNWVRKQKKETKNGRAKRVTTLTDAANRSLGID